MKVLLKEIKEMQKDIKTFSKVVNGKMQVYMGFENDEDGAKRKKYNELVNEYKTAVELKVGDKVLYFDTLKKDIFTGAIKNVLKDKVIIKNISDGRKEGAIIFKSSILKVEGK